MFKRVNIGYQSKDWDAKGPCEVEAKLWNARQLPLPPEMAINGFQLVKFAHGVTDFSSEAQKSGETDRQIRERLYPAFEKLLLRKCPGAKKVVVFNHGLRASTAAPQAVVSLGGPVVKPPVKEAHSDFSPSISPLVVKKLAPEVDCTRQRYALINLWMSVDQHNAVMKTPLAFLDAQTVSDEDLIDAFITTGKNSQVKEWTGEMEPSFRGKVKQMDPGTTNEKHGWFYYPKMMKDEAVIFKQYDNAMTEAQACIHAAIELEETGVRPSPARQSIEARALVIYPSSDDVKKQMCACPVQ